MKILKSKWTFWNQSEHFKIKVNILSSKWNKWNEKSKTDTIANEKCKNSSIFSSTFSFNGAYFLLYVCAPSLPKKVARFLDIFLQFLAPQRSLKFFALRVFEHFFDKISALALLNIFTPTYIFWPTKPAINYVFLANFS